MVRRWVEYGVRPGGLGGGQRQIETSRSTVSRIRDGHRRGRARVPRPIVGPHLVPLRLRLAPPTWTWEDTETVDFRIVLITRALGSVRPRARQCDGLHDLRQTTPEAVAAQCERVIDSLKDAFPKAAQMLVNAQPDLTAFAAFRGTGPRSGRSNPIERLEPRNPAPRRRRPGSSPTATASPA